MLVTYHKHDKYFKPKLYHWRVGHSLLEFAAPTPTTTPYTGRNTHLEGGVVVDIFSTYPASLFLFFSAHTIPAMGELGEEGSVQSA